jgi:hypothetical protein
MGPEEIGMGLRVHLQESAVGSNEVGGQKVVDRHAYLRTRYPIPPPSVIPPILTEPVSPNPVARP